MYFSLCIQVLQKKNTCLKSYSVSCCCLYTSWAWGAFEVLLSDPLLATRQFDDGSGMAGPQPDEMQEPAFGGVDTEHSCRWKVGAWGCFRYLAVVLAFKDWKAVEKANKQTKNPTLWSPEEWGRGGRCEETPQTGWPALCRLPKLFLRENEDKVGVTYKNQKRHALKVPTVNNLRHQEWQDPCESKQEWERKIIWKLTVD